MTVLMTKTNGTKVVFNGFVVPDRVLAPLSKRFAKSLKVFTSFKFLLNSPPNVL